MQKKFECVSCHNRFLAEDSGNVSCPKCKSDNIRPAKTSISAIVGSIMLFFVFGIIGWFVGGLFSEEETQSPKAIVSNNDGVVSRTDEDIDASRDSEHDIIRMEEKTVIDIDITEPISVAYDSNPIGSGEGETTVYSFKAWVDHLPKNAEIKEFQVTDNTNENKVIKTAGPDGNFSDVPYSRENGNYKLFAILTTGQKSEPKPISGFNLIPARLVKLTPEEIQTMINGKDESLLGGQNPQVVARPTLKYRNLQGEHPYKYFDDVLQALVMGEWSSVQVNNLGYDSHNRVNMIDMTIVYP